MRTIARASDRLNVSSPSISAAISQLEAEFKTELFIRHHAQGLSLTPGGRRIYNEARQILHDAQNLNELARDIRDKPSGPLTVGFLITIAPVLAANLRRSFETAYPDARVTILAGHQGELINMLNRAEIDLAVTYDMELPKDINFHPIAALPTMVVLPQTHPLAKRTEIPLADLTDEPFVLLDLPHTSEFFLGAFLARGLRPTIAERPTDMSVLRSLVANGYGYSLLNIQTPSTLAPDGQPLAYVPLEQDSHPAILGVAHKRKGFSDNVQIAFRDHLQEQAEYGRLPGL